jgi:hypothetical protein
MDQTKGAGHHAVTHLAVHDFYHSGQADSTGLINGQTERQFFDQLDHWQEHQDRILDRHTIAGPTTHPGWLDGHAQREHSMADPHLSGPANLNIDRNYVVDELDQAHAAHLAGNNVDEMKHLGAAAHALEDSYSDAHMWRDERVYSGDPEAPVKSINVFDPGGFSTHGRVLSEGTHDPHFDHVPVDKSGDPILPNHQAASKAVAHMLHKYFETRDEDPRAAHADRKATVDKFFQPGPEGVHVNDKVTDGWKHERDHRLDETHKLESDFHDRTPPPQPAPPAAPPENKDPLDGGAPPGGIAPQSQTGQPQSQNASQRWAPSQQDETNTAPSGLAYASHAHPQDDQSGLAYASQVHPQDDQSGLAYASQVHPQDDQSGLAYATQVHPQDDQSGLAYATQAHPQDDQSGLAYATQAHPQDDQSSTPAYASDAHSNSDGSGSNTGSAQLPSDSTGSNTGDTGASGSTGANTGDTGASGSTGADTGDTGA